MTRVVACGTANFIYSAGALPASTLTGSSGVISTMQVAIATLMKEKPG